MNWSTNHAPNTSTPNFTTSTLTWRKNLLPSITSTPKSNLLKTWLSPSIWRTSNHFTTKSWDGKHSFFLKKNYSLPSNQYQSKRECGIFTYPGTLNAWISIESQWQFKNNLITIIIFKSSFYSFSSLLETVKAYTHIHVEIIWPPTGRIINSVHFKSVQFYWFWQLSQINDDLRLGLNFRKTLAGEKEARTTPGVVSSL